MTAEPSRVRTRRSPFGAAAAAALGLSLTLAACGGSGSGSKVVGTAAPATLVPAAPSPTTARPAPTAPTTAAPAANAGPATPAPPVPAAGPPAPADPAKMLADAVASLRNGYDVDTNLAAGVQTTNIAGRVVGPNSQFTLTRGDATVEYLRIPPQTWVRDPGDEWKQTTDEAVPRDSLTPFATPTKVALAAAAGDGTHLVVGYDGAAFGSETPVEAQMVLEPNGGITVTYAATTQGKAIAVITRLAPTSNPTPITAP